MHGVGIDLHQIILLQAYYSISSGVLQYLAVLSCNQTYIMTEEVDTYYCLTQLVILRLYLQVVAVAFTRNQSNIYSVEYLNTQSNSRYTQVTSGVDKGVGVLKKSLVVLGTWRHNRGTLIQLLSLCKLDLALAKL